MYEEFLRDPAGVSPEWRDYFQRGFAGLGPEAEGNGHHPSVVEQTERRGDAQTEKPVTTSAAPAAPAPHANPPAPAPAAGAVPITGPAARLVANMNESR